MFFNRAEKRAFYHDLFRATCKELNLLPNTVISAFTTSVETPASEIPEPKSYKQSQEGSYAKEWHAAYVEEYENLLENHTWLLVNRSELSAYVTIIKRHWVFKPKPDADNRWTQFKARWVVQGFTQKECSVSWLWYACNVHETLLELPCRFLLLPPHIL